MANKNLKGPAYQALTDAINETPILDISVMKPGHYNVLEVHNRFASVVVEKALLKLHCPERKARNLANSTYGEPRKRLMKALMKLENGL